MSCAAVANSQQGPVLLVFHQYAYYGKDKSIHSSGQLEHYGNYVNDKSHKIQGGKQLIKTLDGYLFPVQIKSGLPYLNIRPPTDEELKDLPSVVMTSAQTWDPKILDSEFPEDSTNWYNSSDVEKSGFFDYPFDEMGAYTQCEVAIIQNFSNTDYDFFDCIDELHNDNDMFLTLLNR